MAHDQELTTVQMNETPSAETQALWAAASASLAAYQAEYATDSYDWSGFSL